MTDMRRTILWVVFTMSLVLLWDAWNKHNGHPSMFSPSRPAATSSAAPPAQPAASAELPAPAATGSAGAATAGAGSIAAQPQAAAAASEKITLVTDVYRAVVDTQGGSLVRVELLKYEDQHDRGHPGVLMDQSAQRVYLAQSGLINQNDAASPEDVEFIDRGAAGGGIE